MPTSNPTLDRLREQQQLAEEHRTQHINTANIVKLRRAASVTRTGLQQIGMEAQVHPRILEDSEVRAELEEACDAAAAIKALLTATTTAKVVP